MFRHPRYLDIPWEVHWQHEETKPYRHFRWLMVFLILAVMFLIGVGVTSDIK